MLKFILLLMVACAEAYASDSLSYSGRLVNANGSPVAPATGKVDLQVDLAYIASNLSSGPVLCTETFKNVDGKAVPLTNGVFHIELNPDCSASGLTFAQVLEQTPSTHSLGVQVTDLTNSKSYSFQTIHAIPFAKVSDVAKKLAITGNNGQVLTWNAGAWIAANPVGTGTVTSITAGTGLTGGTITTTGTISLADGGVTSAKLNQMGAGIGQVLKWSLGGWVASDDIDTGLTSESDPSVRNFARVGGSGVVPQTCATNQALHYILLSDTLECIDIVLNTTETARVVDAAVDDAIADGVTTVAPSQNAVFDALALKQPNLGSTSDVEVRTLGVGTATPGAALGVTSTLSASSGTEYGMKLFPEITQSSTAGYTGLLVNVTETATGSGAKKLLDLQVGGVSKFSVDSTGAVVSSTPTSGTTATYTSPAGNQLTVGYDTTNKTSVNVDSLGFTTFTANGVGAGYNFSGGGVGIGVLAPSEALDVTGSIKASTGVKAPLLSSITDLTLTADSDSDTTGALIFNTGVN